MLALLALALLQTAPAAQTAPAGPPAWTYREGADATTGKKWATAQIRATEGNGRLVVRCDTAGEPIVSIQYIPKPPLPASDPKIVRVTYDEAKVEVAGWQFPG